MTRYSLLVLCAAALLAGCASNIPAPIREPLPGSPSLAEVRQDPEAYAGARVRWGGTIAGVTNREGTTRIEVVGRRLASGGRPRDGDATSGRFLAEVPGFLDPAVYASGRQVTVTGPLAAPETHDIGDFAYRFPVVEVRAHHLWPEPEKVERRSYPPPWYYDPWYPYYRPYPPYW